VPHTGIAKDTSMPVVRWQPSRTDTPVASPAPWPLPPLLTAIGRGLANRCPSCGKTHLFQGYLRVTPVCANCAAPLGRARADDAPPYFTILIVGHIVVPLLFVVDRTYSPSDLTLAAIFLPLTLVLSLLLLRPIKGGTVGLMLKLGLVKSDPDD
jgi:uncharacterized protein (DUF983 family)